MWVVRKVGIVEYVWICVYAPVNVRNREGREEMKLWNDVKECLMEIGRWSRIVLMREMNRRFENSEVGSVVRKWGGHGMNENGEYLVDIYLYL